jgi:hypothetical protein
MGKALGVCLTLFSLVKVGIELEGEVV